MSSKYKVKPFSSFNPGSRFMLPVYLPLNYIPFFLDHYGYLHWLIKVTERETNTRQMVYSVPCITFLVKQDTTLRSDWLIIYELEMSEWHCGIHVVKTKHSTWWDQTTVVKTEQYIMRVISQQSERRTMKPGSMTYTGISFRRHSLNVHVTLL